MKPEQEVLDALTCGYLDTYDIEPYMETIINALEKQMAKKPTHEASLYRCLTCPTCKNVIDEFTDFLGKKVRVTVQHCRFCGQKLDWEDENE